MKDAFVGVFSVNGIVHLNIQNTNKMKHFAFIIITLLITCSTVFSQTKAGKIDTAKHTALYVCPTHPDVISDKPGKCPKCGMDFKLSGKEQMKMAISKTYTCPVHATVFKHDPGKCPQCGRKLKRSPKEQMKAEATKIYTCPMHPDVALNKDGICPKCGKALIEKKNQ
ncbi:MAG: heavy metal-binding domain-containing protein [Agriterribacter sp.]